MYSPLQHYSPMDYRQTPETVNISHRQHHRHQTWISPPVMQQDTSMNYMVHQDYHVAPKKSNVSTSPPLYQSNIKNPVNRAVIPSKRAAQNRAAQKAFRQRRDRFVKDLEKKCKEMDQWKEETDQIKIENSQLKVLVHQLQARISSLTGEPIPSDQQTSHTMPSPRSSPISNQLSSLSPTPVPSYSSSMRSSLSPPPTTQLPSSPSSSTHSYSPIPLRPYSFVPSTKDTDSMIPSPPTSAPLSFTTTTTVAPAGHAATPVAGQMFNLDLDLDPFFEDDYGFPRMDDQLDFVGHSSGQVLDDLFAMLQTRQRPQIPTQPPIDPPFYNVDQIPPS